MKNSFFNVHNKQAIFIKFVKNYFAEEYSVHIFGCTNHKDEAVVELIVTKKFLSMKKYLHLEK